MAGTKLHHLHIVSAVGLLGLCLLAAGVAGTEQRVPRAGWRRPAAGEPGQPRPAATTYNKAGAKQAHEDGDGAHDKQGARKCTKQSVILARQMLAHELNYINQFNSIWFNDLDKDELIEGQKHSLSNIVMSGAGSSLLNSDGRPLLEIESSYFRPAHHQPGAPPGASPIGIKLSRKHPGRCQLNANKQQFGFVFGLALGPVEHHLDVVYNLPRDLRLGQPLEWRYGQITISVPKMNYEVSLRQLAGYELGAGARGPWPELGAAHAHGCPLEVAELTYLPTASNSFGHHKHGPGSISIASSGLALNNQTRLQIERLFDDYTRPSVSQRLRQLLRFYLNGKTLPLATGAPGSGG